MRNVVILVCQFKGNYKAKQGGSGVWTASQYVCTIMMT